jgi:L-ribulose-5-phosphate 3-epimerase
MRHEMLSLNTWAFAPEMTFLDRVTAAKCAGFRALEINFEENSQNNNCMLSWDTPQSSVYEMRKILQDYGCTTSSICTDLFWKYSLASSDPLESCKARDLTLRMIEQARILEAPSVVIIPGILCTPKEIGGEDRFQSSSEIWGRAAEMIQALAEKAQEAHVTLGVENVYFNSFLLSPLEVKAFVQSIGSSMVGAHLDLGNANIAGFAHDWINVLNDQICAIHLKDSIQWQSTLDTFRPLGFGNINWGKVRSSLENISYEKFVIIEQSYNSNIPQDIFLKFLFDQAVQLLIGD